MEQIEIALRHFRKADQGIDGTEPRAQSQIPRIFLIHTNNEIAVSGNVGRFRAGIDLFEVLQSFEALFAALNADHIEYFTRRHRQLAPNDFVFGLGIAADFDLFDVGFLAFLNLKIQIHGAGVGVGNAHHRQAAAGRAHIDVSFGAINVLDVFGVLLEALGREDVAHVHQQAVGTDFTPLTFHGVNLAQAVGDISGAENFVAREFDGSHVVLCAFVNDEADHHRARRGIKEFDFLDLEIQVAPLPWFAGAIAVEVRQLLLVFLELLVLEDAAAGNPGKHPVFAGLDHLGQALLAEGLRADELDARNFYLGTFFNFESGRGPPGVFVNRERVLRLGPGIALLLVKLLNFLGVDEQFALFKRFADLCGNSFAQLGVGKTFVALELDFREPGVALNQVSQDDAIRTIGKSNPDVIKQAGGVQVPDVVIDGGGQIRVAGLDADIGANQFFPDGRRADVLNLDFRDLGSRQLCLRQRRPRQQEADRAQAKQNFHRRSVS